MDRYESAKKVSILGILGNIFLLSIKVVVGFMSKSQAMIADAANSAGDIFASLMTFIGNKISSEPSDKSHNFGHGKAEYIFSFLISLSMIVVSLKLLMDSVNSLLSGSKLVFSWFLILVCIVTILTKFSLFFYSNHIVKKYQNILVEANMKDHRNDCIVTSFTLLSIIASQFGLSWMDGIVGIGISLWIAYTGVKIFIESYNVLMDISLDVETTDLIFYLAHQYPDIKDIDSISSTPVGYQYVVVLTINVDGNMSTFSSHQLADQLEKDIKQLDKIYNAIIHVNPI